MRERGRGETPKCPFCGTELARPVEMRISDTETGPGGACSCGAFYLADPTGKNAGLMIAQALNRASEELGKEIGDMVPEEDYREAILSYDIRNHRSIGVSKGFMDGYGRLYIIKINKRQG